MAKYAKKISIMCTALLLSLGLHNSGVVKATTKEKKKTNKNSLIIENAMVEHSNECIQVLLKYPMVKIVDNKKIENIINDKIQNYIKKIETLAQKIENSANNSEESLISPYYCATDYIVTYNDNNILSITMVYADYTGGSNGMYTNESFNFDLITGNILSLNNLLKENSVEEMFKLINQNIVGGFNNSDILLFDFKGVNENTKYYLGNTYIEIYFNLYEYASYSAGIPSFKIPYSMLNVNLKYEILNNEEYKYNDGDIAGLLSELSSYEDEYISYIYDPLGLNIIDNNSDIEMLYTAANFINDNYYVYYITEDELATFLYHVYGKKIDIADMVKNHNTQLYKPMSLDYKDGLYYFSKSEHDDSAIKLDVLEKINKQDNIIYLYGTIHNDTNIKNEYGHKKVYGFKLIYKQTDKSILGYNIIKYIWKEIDYKDNILDEIKKNLD